MARLEINMARRNISENVPGALIAFMAKMKVWEVEFFDRRKQALSKGVDDSELKGEYAQSLEVILCEYAIKDKSNYGRLIDLGCTKPATYDPDTDEIQVVGSDEKGLTVQVQQVGGAETASRIYVVCQKGEWKIKKKEILDFDEKWRRAPL
ncbi:NTF2 fold immunity protein [Pseudomonas sp. NBRC 111124]|uniref:NTF2 fold immunity protein n=1 Tax=Pseudomonas sp. NBRC 111124 TaxID=1661039 RepID=UPI00210AC1F2|nr:NTF2 fold immunity protein [Pseudomonas sp. NBRC 111124]